MRESLAELEKDKIERTILNLDFYRDVDVNDMREQNDDDDDDEKLLKTVAGNFSNLSKTYFADACKHELKRDALIAHNFSSFLSAFRFVLFLTALI